MHEAEYLVGEDHQPETGKNSRSDRLAFDFDHRGEASRNKLEKQQAFNKLLHF